MLSITTDNDAANNNNNDDDDDDDDIKDAAVVVQTFVRGAQARRNYAVLVVEHREAAKLENQILALQRKLDEEREARLEMEAVRWVGLGWVGLGWVWRAPFEYGWVGLGCFGLPVRGCC